MNVFIDGEHVRTIECDPYPSFLEVSLDGMTFEDERYKVTFKKQDGL